METTHREATVVFPLRETTKGIKMLMGEKTCTIGIDCLIGPGGMVEPGESPRHTASCEMEEECGLRVAPEEPRYAGVMTFHIHKMKGAVEEVKVIRVHFFLAPEWCGEVKEKESGFINLAWYPLGELPLAKMMAADPYFVPQILAGKQVVGEAYYLNDQRTFSPGREVTVYEVTTKIDVF